MPDGFWISMDGAAAIQRALEEAGAEANRILEKATLAGAEEIRAAAESNAPRFTGELAEHIEKVTSEKSRTEVTVAVGPDVAQKSRKDRKHFYGMFVEFGVQAHTLSPKTRRALAWDEVIVASAEHPGHAARPFMRPALDSQADDAQDRIAEVLKRELGL